MLQTCHLLIVDVQRARSLVARHGSRWLLPMLLLPERGRVGSALEAWSEERGLSLGLRGQWLGRLSADGGLDWLTVVEVDAATSGAQTGALSWVAYEALHCEHALHGYQGWAIETTLAGGEPRVLGPFGNMTWWHAVRRWASGIVGRDLRCARALIHRATNAEVVVEWRCDSHRWFFKGLGPDRSLEASLTAALSELVPGVFARTCGLQPRQDGSVWWLMEELGGGPLAASCSSGMAQLVVERFAVVQRSSQTLCRSLLTDVALQLPRLAEWTLEALIGDDSAGSAATAVAHACEHILRLQHPVAWGAGDLDPANILLDGNCVRFIDLDDAYLGPAPLSVATFARRIHADAALRARLFTVFARIWKMPRLPEESLAAYDLVSRVVECAAAWRQASLNDQRGHTVALERFAHQRIASKLRAIAAAHVASR